MGRNYWMVVSSPEDFEITKEGGFSLFGVRSKYRRRAQRMQPDDRMMYYVHGMRKWTATATIKSTFFEDRTPVWTPGKRRELFPFRVKTEPAIVLDEEDYIDALILAPRLEYLKRWAPEDWPLAFIDSLHLLPQKDFRLIEGEMNRIRSRKKRNYYPRPNGASAQRFQHRVRKPYVFQDQEPEIQDDEKSSDLAEEDSGLNPEPYVYQYQEPDIEEGTEPSDLAQEDFGLDQQPQVFQYQEPDPQEGTEPSGVAEEDSWLNQESHVYQYQEPDMEEGTEPSDLAEQEPESNRIPHVYQQQESDVQEDSDQSDYDQEDSESDELDGDQSATGEFSSDST